MALVTGGGTGIGAAVACRFAVLGWDVAVVGRRTALLEETAHQIEADGATAAVVTADVARVEEAPRIVETTLTRFGRIDALINNAGLMRIEPFADLTPESFDLVLATNLRAPFFLIQAATSALREAGNAVVINIGSAAASMYRPGQSIYGSSKAAVEYLTKSLAVELAVDGIRVNAIVPGPVKTSIHDRPGVDSATLYAALRDATPLGRMGTADEVAWWVATLTGPESSWVTGAIIHIDGGRILAPPERPTSGP